jgi:hypothetical protein
MADLSSGSDLKETEITFVEFMQVRSMLMLTMTDPGLRRRILRSLADHVIDPQTLDEKDQDE